MLLLEHVTFASEDPERLARFWAELLGNDAVPAGEAWAVRGDGPELFFHRMAKTKTIELPIHLDINVPDREAEIERLRGLGAYAVITKTEGLGDFSETFTVMHDPEGNGFCVQGPDPRRPKPYVGNVTFSCAEPRRLAAFWAEALGWNEEEPPEAFLRKLLDAGLDPAELDSYAAVRHPDGSRPRLLFQRRQKSPTESIPIHMDFLADDREADVARLVGLGATVTETKEGWTVMGDPEGNPFCVS